MGGVVDFVGIDKVIPSVVPSQREHNIVPNVIQLDLIYGMVRLLHITAGEAVVLGICLTQRRKYQTVAVCHYCFEYYPTDNILEQIDRSSK